MGEEEWVLRRRSYTEPPLPRQKTSWHPLVAKPVTALDPLSMIETSVEIPQTVSKPKWALKKQSMLKGQKNETLVKLQQQMQKHWAADERVAALKAAIQVAKMLSEPRPQYPSFFVLATDVLDDFGKLVYERVKNKRETCRNWFYKTACIQELVPRFYIEASLLPCYSFLNEYPIARLGSIIRGIGDPLVATYARCYLMKEEINKSLIHDSLFTYKFHPEIEPGLSWILRGCDDSVLDYYDATVLKIIIQNIDVSKKAFLVVELVKATNSIPLLGILGERFAEYPPPKDQRLAILNEVWKVVQKSKGQEYVDCATKWLDCLLKHYTDREVGLLLGDVIAHLDGTPVDSLLQSLCARSGDQLLKLLGSNLVKLLDKTERKVETAKELLAAIKDGDVHTILEVARVAHDSLDSLSPDGERRHIASLILSFVNRVDKDIAIYVECRAAFPNLDAVLERLILLSALTNDPKAALAFMHVTIPSIDDESRRFRLLTWSGTVALKNNCLPHADTFFKAAISLIPKLDSFDLASVLILVPGHPAPFYLFQGIYNALKQKDPSISKFYNLLQFLPYFAAQAQRKLPYSLVEANDVLYGGSHVPELHKHLGLVIEDLLSLLATFEPKPRIPLILDLIDILCAHFDLHNGQAAKLVNKLQGLLTKVQLSHEHQTHLRNINAFIKADIS